MDADVTALRSARAEAAARLAALERSHADVVAATEDANTDDEHDPEGATIGFERAQLGALADATRRRLAELDAALERAATGRYGVCAGCGGRIDPERLAARPGAATCIDCARVSPATRRGRAV